ncbi:formyltetrahydrofolate deformylase [Ferroacidibacillus organovorans]|uniref:Formyltetrahydrofolate deformylase n=1 Tax=Ferroacidibacillus organovorans TaxID=1765683 RepID=A0A124IW95_9BACL|nr:formyltetrahydrofolate deformylase [Ferroacidibacillus organovorans]KUO96695.1 formyltetrahydrofolate deformylase [Ferroacidibacillus organovorans]
MLEYNAQARLLVSCKDQPGIVANISSALYQVGANITESAQFSTDPTDGMFFMRIAFDHHGLHALTELNRHLRGLQASTKMTYRLTDPNHRLRIAIFVSREDHCLMELLWQQRTNMLPVDIAMIISNHDLYEKTAQEFSIPFHYIPITKDTKIDAENAQHRLLESRVDLIVLARYMQILSRQMIARYPNKIINIHHSFLPAFIGARPYERAYERGVKIIGATAHYVTDELDAGPIIEQDITRVKHSDDVASLKKMGRLIEKNVLARAVKWHAEDRVLVHNNKTIVFT